MLILIPDFLVTAGMSTWSLCLERIHVRGCCVSYVVFMFNGFIREHVCAGWHSDFCTSGFHKEKVSMLFVVLLILLPATHSFIQPFSTSCFKSQGARHNDPAARTIASLQRGCGFDPSLQYARSPCVLLVSVPDRFSSFFPQSKNMHVRFCRTKWLFVFLYGPAIHCPSVSGGHRLRAMTAGTSCSRALRPGAEDGKRMDGLRAWLLLM